MKRTFVCGLWLVGAAWMASCGSSNEVKKGEPDAALPPPDATLPPPDSSLEAAPDRAVVPPTWNDSRFFAIHTLSLGDTDRSGAPSPTAWKKYGRDIDGKTSVSTSTDHCRLKPGAPSKVKQDGDDGIDNSFGANIIPILTTAAPDLSKLANDTIKVGTFTHIIHVSGLDGDATQSTTGLKGQLFEGAKLTSPPRWDGTDEWPVLPGTLADGTLAGGSKTQFNDASVKLGLFQGAAGTSFSLRLPLGDAEIVVPIDKAILSFQKPVNGVEATGGTIAGVVNTARFNSEFLKMAGYISTTLCSASTAAQVTAQFAQASDIMSDGTNGDPTKECDAISIGIGFTATALKPPTRVAPPPVQPPDPCR